MSEAPLRLQIFFDWYAAAQFVAVGDFTSFRLEQRKESGFDCQARDLDGICGCRTPTERAWYMNVNVARDSVLAYPRDIS